MDKYISYLILESIVRGCDTKSCIMRRLSGIDRNKIKETLQELRNGGYIVEKIEGRLIRKVKYEITEDGKRLLEQLREDVRREVTEKISRTKKLVEEKRHEEAKAEIEPIAEYIPALAALGLIEDLALLSFLSDVLAIPLMALTTAELAEELEDIEDIEELDV